MLLKLLLKREKMGKPKLNFDSLYQKLTDKNISFNNHSKDEVIEYLKHRSYYYKISSDSKNFPKTSNGEYENVDFLDLTNCASLDIRIRELLLLMSLDVEHSLKTRFMALLTEDDQEDGYSIIEEFEDQFRDKFADVIAQFRANQYKKDMFKKRPTLSVWVFLEIVSYGTFTSLAELYKEKKELKKDSLYTNQHKFIKNIRNSCAHNNVFLINLFDKDDHIPRPDAQTKSYASTMKINLGLVHYPKIIDIINLFYLHKKTCSAELNKRRIEECDLIIHKYTDNIKTFEKSRIKKFFDSVFKKCIDFLKE